ncbi:MAG: glycosyltransferase family 2 protein [Acidobacteria bacterium]|nr:glycosyltransferase family 2 protein [Acidobacteriota bacterium]
MNEAPPAVAAIVLSFNGRAAVVRCVESLRGSSYPRLDVIVVDNASTDGTPDEVERRFPGCLLLRNGQNLGFGAGCNVGMEAALDRGAELLFLVNQDTYVDRATIATLAKFMGEHPRAGVVGPKTWSSQPMPDGRPKLLYAGSWRGRLPLSQRLPGIEQADAGQFDRPSPTDFVWGHGMMLRASALRAVGLFDPAFFMYYEDLDLCRRMQAGGHEVWFEPRAVMWHDIADGARGLTSEPWRWECKVHSAGVFHRKYHGAAAAGVLTALTVLQEARMLLRAGRSLAARHLFGAYVRDLSGRVHPAGPPLPSAARNG